VVARSRARRDKPRQQRCTRDYDRCSRWISFPDSEARDRLPDADSSARRSRPQQSSKIRVRASSSEPRHPGGASVHHQLSKRACHVIRDRISHDWSSARPSLPRIAGEPLLHVARDFPHCAHRSKSNLPWRSLSNGYTRRLVHWCSLGHGLLGADGVASACRSGGTAQSGVKVESGGEYPRYSARQGSQ